MFEPARLPNKKGLTTGRNDLDSLLALPDGLFTLRCRSTSWLFWMASTLIARNTEPGFRILYLQWVDYHDRYWSIDYDLLIRLAKRAQTDPQLMLDNTIIMRVFSRDGVEEEENWKQLFALNGPFRFIILDSINGLYSKFKREVNAKPMGYSIGRFSQLCMEKRCAGIVLDDSSAPLHPYLGELSSVILQFTHKGAWFAHLQKHPLQPEIEKEIAFRAQRTLARWLA
ncbi:hypothetical protein KJ765_02910 [Candidatus Micrarchaeota archaeon]|nr:hypothetical protein [Candidatus Micrarchaeota archaeon]